ncbi:selenocysteine-specific translation elongation factor [Bradyrhizobium sp. Arg237L]|uniref:selenocysteine-specific translation elongation factor n=1 Tax=Bradyrhizobium sp. Arg237L TaxID=3003352 RepID=UPI00249F0D19|nr:selenocysteine-specific translation elongation factor [Bradyrhizobium sp. Arg237L]MDI4234826.1 selenocysteine-specific translation elongation factor [Bradyrhizobium sp. Arg237L]
MIIGTAGHIDHGKTALVKALTGVDGDRLKEEKARGITIDLGFAYLPVDGGEILGFIDVPGHERLVHTMLAGASGIDFALLVIAADDGIMPQTLEHLAIIDLLGIRHGIVALTKSDLVSPKRLADLSAQVREAIGGTSIEGADIVPVSAPTGRGIDDLRARLAASAKHVSQRSAAGRFRLAVDRVFTLQGIGVVVTGTVLSGSVRVEDHILISPSGLPARVRSLHAQNKPAEIGRAGDRCALNLAGEGITKESIHRGDVVLDPDLHAPTDRIDARLRLLPGETKPIKQWLPVRLHHASTEIGARIVLLGDEPVRPGATADVQLVLERPIAAAIPDRYVIRDASAQRTMGGGYFIDLRPPKRRRGTAERRAQRAALALFDPLTAFKKLLATSPFAWDLAAFARGRALSATEAKRIEDALDLVVLETRESRLALAPDRWQLVLAELTEHVAAYHRDNPDLQGIGREKLRLMFQPPLPAAEFAAALQKMASMGHVVLDGSFVRLPTHAVRLSPRDEESWATVQPLLAGGARFRPPRVRDIATATGHPERDIRRLLKLAGRMGWADEIAHDHFFLRGTVLEMVGIVADLAGRSANGVFTAAQFRDRVENGRKVAIQILDFFDRHGVTVNKDDMRRINRHRLDLFGPLVHSTDQIQGRESSPVGRSDFKSE